MSPRSATIEIPDEVRDVYRLWRPTPLYRARRLERALDTPAHIYYKYEGVSPPGSHKPNTAVAQAYYNKAEGIRRLTTETGAGQWGSALAFACALFGLECTVYMVKASYEQKPYRRSMIQTYGAEVFASPSDRTHAGQSVLADDPDSPGSLGIAISEAVEDAATHDDAHYSLGSVLNHVLLHQTVIGQEALKQMDLAGEYPDVVIGCVGGGSNFAGLAFPFVGDKLRQGRKTRIVAVEPRGLPDAHAGQVRLRLRRHGRSDAPGEDAHARPRLRAAGHPRRRPALSRRRAAALAAGRRGDRRGTGLWAEQRVRSRGTVRAH